VRFHDTPIVTLYKSGSARIWTGWYYLPYDLLTPNLPITKQRINLLTGAGVYEQDQEWYVQGLPFEEGMQILPDGRVDLLHYLYIGSCPIDHAYPEIAADWLEDHGRDEEGRRLRELWTIARNYRPWRNRP
jgi:hypothetical protein